MARREGGRKRERERERKRERRVVQREGERVRGGELGGEGSKKRERVSGLTESRGREKK